MPKITKLAGEGDFEMEVHGESYYQPALENLAKLRKRKDSPILAIAHLIPEPNNPSDRNAVRIDIDGATVGYLPRAIAPRYMKAIAKRNISGIVECPARIRGGFVRGSETFPFGVRLDLPDDLISAIQAMPNQSSAFSVKGNRGGGCLKWVLVGVVVLVVIAIIGALLQ